MKCNYHKSLDVQDCWVKSCYEYAIYLDYCVSFTGLKQIEKKSPGARVPAQESAESHRLQSSSLTNLISFYDQVTRLVDEEKAMDVVYLGFSKAFDTVSHSIFLEKLTAHGLDGCTLC